MEEAELDPANMDNTPDPNARFQSHNDVICLYKAPSKKEAEEGSTGTYIPLANFDVVQYLSLFTFIDADEYPLHRVVLRIPLDMDGGDRSFYLSASDTDRNPRIDGLTFMDVETDVNLARCTLTASLNEDFQRANARDSVRRLQRETTCLARFSTTARPRHRRNAAARRRVLETRRNAACAPAKEETRWTCAARQREKLACTADMAPHSVSRDSSAAVLASSASSSASRRRRSTSSAQSRKARANAARRMRCRHRVTFTASRLSLRAASRQRLNARNAPRWRIAPTNRSAVTTFSANRRRSAIKSLHS